METAKTAQSVNGDKPYQVHARRAFPMLVRLAHAGSTIFYADLADRLGMKNPRNLNYPLGSIGVAIEELSAKWGQKIPLIQSLVINQSKQLPGPGIDWFVRDFGDFKRLGLRQQRALVSRVHAEIFAFPRWNEVLAELGLEPDRTSYRADLESAARYRGGGESEHHAALKRFVAANPKVIGLPGNVPPGATEFAIPSGDSVDVYFSHASARTGVEVKSYISDRADIVRGLFQCVKYRAVLTACIAAEGTDEIADAVLVLARQLPDDLVGLKNLLAVKVVENVRVPDRFALEVIR